MVSSQSQSFPTAPPKPRPTHYPPNHPPLPQNPNLHPSNPAAALPNAMQNLHITRSSPPSAAIPAALRGPPPFPTCLPGPPPRGSPQAPGRPSPSPFPQPGQPQPPFTSPPLPPRGPQAPLTGNAPPSFGPGGPRFPPSSTYQHPPPGGTPMVPPASFGPPRSLPPTVHSQAQGAPAFARSPMPGVPLGPPPPQPYIGPPRPFMGPPTPGIPLEPSPWQTASPQGVAPMPDATPPRMIGMPPVSPLISKSPLSGAHVSMTSKIDPNDLPRPMPSSSIVMFETRLGNQANIPPPASSNFIVKDNGNCSPRLMRCTLNQIPCTEDLLSASSMPLALLVQPLALPHPSEEPIQIVDFGENGPVRCSRCKGYINPFVKFIDLGRRFICSLCGFTNETRLDYLCNLGPDGRRHDADERPELCRGAVEFVATEEYMVREPMPPVFFFLIDVSFNAVQTGATAAACSSINQAIADLPDGPRTMVGIATFDSTIHFYNLKQALQQPSMLIVADVHDVYTPLHTDLIVQLDECREHLEHLLESIPSIFVNSKVTESAFGAAMKAASLSMKPTGGKLLVFQSVLPSVGIGSLSSREAEGRKNVSSVDKDTHKLLQPADKTLEAMAIELAEYQVCVDLFITTQTYVDITSISVVPRITGGQPLALRLLSKGALPVVIDAARRSKIVKTSESMWKLTYYVYHYYPFSALSDPTKIYNDLRWNISRPQGFEAVMRVRCSQGLQVQEYSGNFCMCIPTDMDLPGIDCDKSVMVTFKHDGKFKDDSECAFQCSLAYTNMYGQRRIRVINLSLSCTSSLNNIFCSADLDTQFACFLKQAANDIPTTPLPGIREQITNLCINILHSYRKSCATVSSLGHLIFPEALKFLPLYTIALIKSTGLRNNGRLDDRSYWISRAASLSVSLAVPLLYPRMISIHDLTSKDDEGSSIPPAIPLSCEHLNDDGIYLLEKGEDALIYLGDMVNPNILQQLFGISSVDGIPAQLVVPRLDNDISKKLNDVVNEIRCHRRSYLRFQLCRKGDPSGMIFLSSMVEDKTPDGLSYAEFLVHVHQRIESKMV